MFISLLFSSLLYPSTYTRENILTYRDYHMRKLIYFIAFVLFISSAISGTRAGAGVRGEEMIGEERRKEGKVRDRKRWKKESVKGENKNERERKLNEREYKQRKKRETK
jgi:hypothetical protein